LKGSVILGGFTCADMLRQNGFHGRIILFTSEETLPYDRVSIQLINQRKRQEIIFKVQLSKQPSKNPQDLLLRDQSYFKKAKIDLLLDTEVTNINWIDKSLTYKILDNQIKSIQYDYLVLATGLRPRKLPSSLPGYNFQNISYLRSIQDANNLVSKYS
jgi:3-phenylpropionate/trans-cinnamate dioxygenase ferredoxin reductase subunit